MKWLLYYFLAHLLVTLFAVFLRNYLNDEKRDWTLESIGCEAKEIAACMLILPLIIGWLPRLPARRQTAHSPPIILVPGYSLNRLSLWTLERYLNSCGYQNTLAINNPVHKDNIHAFAENLSSIVDDFSWRHNDQPVTLIAHSMGGIISRTYIEKYGSEKISAVITIGTPWQGTLNHHIGLSKHIHQMAPDSEFCTEPLPLSVPHLSLWSSRDWIVLPTRNSIHEQHNMHCITHSGHLGMLFSADVFRIIRTFLHDLYANTAK